MFKNSIIGHCLSSSSKIISGISLAQEITAKTTTAIIADNNMLCKKSYGPSTEPWGTPCDREAVAKVQLLMQIIFCLFTRWDLTRRMWLWWVEGEFQAGEKNGIGDGVKSSEIKEEENAELAGICREEEVICEFEEVRFGSWALGRKGCCFG